jgi:hypothetical protein
MASALSMDSEFVELIEEDIEKCQDLRQRISLIKQRDILSSGVRWKWFYEDTKSIIEEWNERPTDTNEITSLSRRYLSVVKKYYDWIKILWEPHSHDTCQRCGLTLKAGEGCEKCERSPVKEKSSYKEKKNTSGSVDNFIRCIRAITVSKCEPLPESVCNSLDDYARSVGMYTGSDVRNMALEGNGHRGPYTISDLMELLRLTGHTEYYPEKWWVAKNYWGWEARRITPSVEEEIRRDCAAVFSMYAEEQEVSASINREWLAVRILLNHKSKLSWNLSLSDFDLIKTPDILESYENQWSRFCERYPTWNACPIYGTWEIDGR